MADHRRLSLRRLAVSSLAAVALGLAGWLALSRAARDPFAMAEPGEVWPGGRWHLRTPSRQPAVPDDRARDLARLISLGYAAGTVAAGDEGTGVTVHDPTRATKGVNLYTSGHAPEALLLDMAGQVLHRWGITYERAFGPPARGVEAEYFRRAALLPNGELVAIFQGGGMVRLDRDSNLLWRHEDAFFNDFFVAADGTVYGLIKRARNLPELSGDGLVLEDAILVLPPNGEPRRISLLQSLLDASSRALLGPFPVSGDVLHSNTLEVFDGTLASANPLFAAGRALVSFREVHLLAIVDLGSGEQLWSLRGSWRRQHQPAPLADGRLLLFDNRGGTGRSRVVELDTATGALLWEYAGPPARPLDSPEAGSVQRLGRGNTLITESDQGRAFEITHEGAVVWEFTSPHRAGPRQELVATLFEMVRYPQDHVSWLAERSVAER